MGHIAVGQICEAVRAAFEAPAVIARGEAVVTITPNLQDLPKVVVFNQSGESNRASFGRLADNPMRINDLQVYADVWVAPLNWFGQEMAQTMQVLDAEIDMLETINGPIYFGLEGIKSFNSYTWEFITPVYGEGISAMTYMGLRFVLDLEVY